MVPEIRSTPQVRAAAAEPPAVVRVRNLQATISGPSDAWGRLYRQQPISISAAVTLNRVFGSSSSDDKVAADTIHYGLLSKAILATLGQPIIGLDGTSERPCLKGLLDNIWAALTGLGDRGEPAAGATEKPFLDVSAVRCLEVTLHLPKASLLGSGVSLTKIALFGRDGSESTMQMLGHSLKIHDLRVPTLIGVNDNERRAKQVVVANLEIDKFDVMVDDFAQIEAEAVKVMSESSYETLEALATDMSIKLSTYLHSHHAASQSGWPLRILLEKPIAVVLADAACVELGVHTGNVIGALSS